MWQKRTLINEPWNVFSQPCPLGAVGGGTNIQRRFFWKELIKYKYVLTTSHHLLHYSFVQVPYTCLLSDFIDGTKLGRQYMW